MLPKANAFKALMKFLKEDAYVGIVGDRFGKIPAVKEFLGCLEHIDVKDSDFTSRNFVPGSGGQAVFLKVLRGELKRRDVLVE